MELNVLRQELEKATQGIPRKHPELIASPSEKYPHRITVQCNPNFMDSTSDCFIYVFKEKIPNELIEKICNVSAISQEELKNYFQDIRRRIFVRLYVGEETKYGGFSDFYCG